MSISRTHSDDSIELHYCPNNLIEKKDWEHYVNIARDFVALHGIMFVDEEGKKTNIPHTLFPSPVYRIFATQMERLQLHYNLLYHTVALDHDFLEKALKASVEVDDFTARLWNLYMKVREEGIAQPLFLGMNRSDYMAHYGQNVGMKSFEINRYGPLPCLLDPPKLKQVEFNLMASSFGGQSTRMGKLHRLMLLMNGFNEEIVTDNVIHPKPVDGLAKGLYMAWKRFGNPRAAILFVVGEKEANRLDHRLLELSLYKHCDPTIKVLRRTFQQIKSEGAHLIDNKNLILNDVEIAVVYFRHGYAPHHFDEEVWETKELIERSRAIKCPCIQYMLANTKMVQKALCDEDVIRHYSRELEIDFIDDILASFAGMYDVNHKEALEEALLRENEYVLKPQREGGGNNLFGVELRKRLLQVRNTPDADQYILMKRLRPLRFKNILVPPSGEAKEVEMVSEYGAFGVFLGEGRNVYSNFFCGFLIRSKPANVDEGGIAAGFGCIDSPYWIDMDCGIDGLYLHAPPYL